MLRPYIGTGYPSPGDPHDLLDQLVVPGAGDARRFGKARVHRRVGNDPGERIQLDDVGYAEPVHADIDAAPITAAVGAIGVEGDALGLTAERIGHVGGRAVGTREWVVE